MSEKHGLGRGFESLIPTDSFDEEFDLTAGEDEKVSQLTKLSLDEIARDEEQPRKDFGGEALQALAESIKEHGVLQPIVVTKEEDKYKIVAGERRFRAAKLAGLKEIPAIIRTLDAQNRLEISIIENAQREDLNAMELATAYAKLKAQFNLSAKEIADRIGKSESSVVNTLRLLNLPEFAKKTMVKEKLSEGVMRPLVRADKEMIEEVLPKIVEEGWTARKVERYMSEHKKKSSVRVIKENTYIKEEDAISAKLGAKVRVRGRSVTIACKNDDDLKRILDFLNK
ncbi:ParB/RepB/Spo0J family partition protein [Candidatus Saccharibacteria bacterium]|nr:ParB/RepB/Spo0J family partition protein [Candidatus Saccharibacteria bacterium]